MGTYNSTFKSVVFESVEVKSVKSVRIKNFLRRLRMVQKIIADFWRTFGGLSKILKNELIGYGHLQLHFQKCSFRKCRSQNCKIENRIVRILSMTMGLGNYTFNFYTFKKYTFKRVTSQMIFWTLSLLRKIFILTLLTSTLSKTTLLKV